MVHSSGFGYAPLLAKELNILIATSHSLDFLKGILWCFDLSRCTSFLPFFLFFIFYFFIFLEQVQHCWLLGGHARRKGPRARGWGSGVGSLMESGSPRARPMGDCQPVSLRLVWRQAWRQPGVGPFFIFFVSGACLSLASGGASADTFSEIGGPRAVYLVTIGKPRGFPRSVRSQRLFNMSRLICNDNKKNLI